MRIWSGKVRLYSGRVLVASAVLLAGACSFDTTAPLTLSITSTLGAPVIRGSVTFSGTNARVDSMFQVSVTVTNDSTAPVSFGYGPCGLNFALYQNVTHSGDPYWQHQGVCQSIAEATIAAGQSLTVTTVFPFDSLKFIAKDTSYITANTIYYGGNTMTVDAGTLAFAIKRE
jgi:hypothetical protein